MKKPSLRRYPLSYYLIGATFLILMIGVAGLISISYLATEKTLRDNARLVNLQSENNVVAHFKSQEESIRLYDESLNQQMERAFPPFLAEYDRAGGDPARMDLEAVKQEIGGEMELYVIDENATIVATTYPVEMGLNFTEFAPYFADYLGTIRLSSGFFPDRIVSEKSTGKIRKFAYMPTRDHRYILELGLPNITPDLVNYQYKDVNLIRKLMQSNPYLVQVRVFDTTLRQKVNNTSVEVTDPALKTLLAAILANRTTPDVPDSIEGHQIRYLFIDLRNERYGSDVSRIIELTYTDQPIHDALASSALYHLSFGLIVLISCGLLALLAIRNLTRPIGKMVEDVDTIAGGDLDHPITPPIGAELLKLEESISAMVIRLKAMIAELKTGEENYRSLVQSANSIILRFNTTGDITFINDYALKFFGYTREEIIGRNLIGTIVPEYGSDGESLATKIRDLSVHPEKYEVSENENTRRDGSLAWISWTNRPLNDKQGNVVEILSIGNDITRLKQVELEIQNLNNELEKRVSDRTRQLTEVNKNLESFTYTVSHDLRAPLRAISGYSSILLQDLKDIPEKDRKHLESVRQNAHDMGRLIDDLLDFSKLGMYSLEKVTVQPAQIVKDVLREVRMDPCAKNVEFKIGELPPCQADHALIKQVYANLISNALKFSRNREHPVVEIGSLTKDGRLIFFVRDNGIGFDMRYARKIFGVFERLHNAEEYEGTGVGLAIVQRIIEIHGGRVWVESEVDKGTTFYFTCW
ncbi:MAG: ATP-binding protein [Methanoregulaceae archaeon]|jgi:PAS domain S-box-containing protein|nr:PAS domain S-box protein [Methanoregulaceae archaeon]MCU0628642.1 ATP-binding protein [Methanoregulaceae archaeon]